MDCERCLKEAPLVGVVYAWNFGAIAVRFSHIKAYRLCRPCVHKAYWINFCILIVGWASITSLIFAPLFLVQNTIQYVRALTSRTAAPDPEGVELLKSASAAMAQKDYVSAERDLRAALARAESAGPLCR